jgi:hypothetical protein
MVRCYMMLLVHRRQIGCTRKNLYQYAPEVLLLGLCTDVFLLNYLISFAIGLFIIIAS